MNYYSQKRRIAYYETDAMTVVHHSNHLRYFEEVRVAWFRDRGMGKITWEENEMYFPLIESSVKYIKPLRFDDEVELRLQVRREGTRFYFRYAIYLLEEGMDKRSLKFQRKTGAEPVLLAIGTTTHVLVDQNFKVAKMVNQDANHTITQIMEKEPWTEIWP
ncbi:MAG: acyl-CoA thioesterase [Bdellovibrionales bacterium]